MRECMVTQLGHCGGGRGGDFSFDYPHWGYPLLGDVAVEGCPLVPGLGNWIFSPFLLVIVLKCSRVNRI